MSSSWVVPLLGVQGAVNMLLSLQGKACLGTSRYLKVSAAFWMPSTRVWQTGICCCVLTWTSKWENASISVSDQGAHSGSWNLMQFLVKHSGLVEFSGWGNKLQGEELCDDDRRNGSEEQVQKTPCATNLLIASWATPDAVTQYWSISMEFFCFQKQGMKYSSLPMRFTSFRKSSGLCHSACMVVWECGSVDHAWACSETWPLQRSCSEWSADQQTQCLVASNHRLVVDDTETSQVV